jgi:hypothetical protein
MWLLNTASAKLQWYQFDLSRDYGQSYILSLRRKEYAILSHVWGENEDTFEQVRNLVDLPIDNRWQCVSAKVRNCCRYAAGLGFEWVWIDTCCIDKSSSAELSEAINSMYQWYEEAALCIAFLADLEDVDISRQFQPYDAFRRSNWFTRGWTLQELVAPRNVVFVSSNWKRLGTKAGLADSLERRTGIDIDVLCCRRALMEVSVARRISWASGRQTTRVEDEAYSLMGLFQIHMPIINCEGRAAFRRLQEEILRHCSDHTLFAWSVPWRSPWAELDSQLLASAPEIFAGLGEHLRSFPLTDYPKAFQAFARATGVGKGLFRKVLIHQVCSS